MINLQKSFGQLDIKFKDNEIKKFYQKGCSKSIIPNVAGKLEQMILINTSGGITSGDKLSTRIELDNSSVCTSTQAAEKIYKGSDEPAEINIDLKIINNSNMFWLPQEMILFNNCNIRRKINIEVDNNSNFLMCESIVFGRTSMKENFESGIYFDFWQLFKNEKLIHVESSNTKGYEKDLFSKAASFNKKCAVNVILAVGENIIKKAEMLKSNLVDTKFTNSEISIWDEKLVIRTLSLDNYHLRIALEKIMSYFFNDNIPKIWSI